MENAAGSKLRMNITGKGATNSDENSDNDDGTRNSKCAMCECCSLIAFFCNLL